MTVRDGVIEGSTITFLLSGHISRGSTPLLDLLIRRSRRLGLSVTFALDQVTGVEREALRQLLIWQAEGVTLSDAPTAPERSGSWTIVSLRGLGVWN
jgi:hypothetical protein